MSWEEGLREYVAFLKQKHSLSDEQINDALFAERIPIEAFANDLTPLQAAARYLAQHRGKDAKAISALLGRSTTEVEHFLSVRGPPLPSSGSYALRADLFADRSLSASEHLIAHLQTQGLSVSAIAALLRKAEPTVWTLHYRVQKKRGART